MKRIIYVILVVFALVSAGCSNYALKEDLEALQKEVAELKSLCEQLNDDVAGLNTIVDAFKDGKMVTHTVKTSYGWTIYFNDDTYCDLRDGEKGETGDRGEPGVTPVIGVAMHTDGEYYWTLNGEFILVDEKMVATTGDDAPAPSFQLGAENMLQVSYDAGKSWSDVGKVEGFTTVPSAVTDVEVTEDNVTFVLAEGEPLVMARYKALKINVSTPEADGGVYTAGYTLVGAGENVQVVCSTDDGWKASVTRKDAVSGTITLTAPTEWVDGLVLVFAYSDEQVAMTVINVTQDVIEINQNEYPVEAAGGSFPLPVSASFVPYVSTTDSWVSVVETKALTVYNYTVTVQPNETDNERTAAINFYKNEGGLLLASIAVRQSGKASSAPVTLSVSADLSGSIWEETTVKAISVSSEENLSEDGDKTVDASSGSVAVLPVSSIDVLFTLANGQAFTYTSSVPADGQIALSGLDAMVEAGTVVPSYYDLAGEDGTKRANCYIVLDGGYYKFPADFLNDGTTAIDAVSADWLWSEGEASLLSGVSLVDKYVQFCVQANKKGNAAIATKADAGHISWSWHIWMLQEDPTASHHYARNTQNYPLMNYHLGATTTEQTVDALGLYYQWGRKDPFPRANTMASSDAASETGQFANYTLGHVVNDEVFGAINFVKSANGSPAEAGLTDIQYAIQHPLTFLSAVGDSDIPTTGIKAVRTWLSTTELTEAYKLWNKTHDGTNQDLNAIKSTDKTNYDPCPAGYIVPSSARTAWHNGSVWKIDNVQFKFPNNVSFIFTNPTDGTSGYYPASGYRTDGKLQNLSVVGSTWASYLVFNTTNSRLMGQMMRIETPTFGDDGMVTGMGYIGSGTFQTSSALPVRCCKIVD